MVFISNVVFMCRFNCVYFSLMFYLYTIHIVTVATTSVVAHALCSTLCFHVEWNACFKYCLKNFITLTHKHMWHHHQCQLNRYTNNISSNDSLVIRIMWQWCIYSLCKHACWIYCIFVTICHLPSVIQSKEKLPLPRLSLWAVNNPVALVTNVTVTWY